MTSASRTGWIALRVLAIAFLLAGSAEAAVSRLLEADERHAVVEIRPAAPTSITMTAADGRTYARLTIPELGATAEPGRPEVPVGCVRLAIPPGTTPRLRVIQEEWSPRIAGAIVPVPNRVAVREAFGPNYVAEEPPEEGELYRAGTVYPEVAFRLSAVKGMRVVRVVELEFAGARAEVFARAYRVLLRAVVEVSFDPERSPAAPRAIRPAHGDELWERTTRSGVLNAEQARAFARGGPGDATSVGDTPWGPGVQWRIVVGSSGLAEVSFAALAAAGFPSGVPIAQVGLYQRTFDIDSVDDPGTAAADLFVPLTVPVIARDRNSNGTFDASDGLVFFGRSVRDQWLVSGWEHEDRYDTRNFVWARIDPAGGARMATRAGAVPTATDSLASTPFTLFREEDREYTQYPGDFGPGRDDFEAEFFYWNSHRTSTGGPDGWPMSDPFAIQDLVPGAAGTLRARVCPTGRPLNSSFNNVLTFSMNGTQVGQRTFFNNSSAIYQANPSPMPATVIPTAVLNTYAIPPGILLEGANTFSFLGKSYQGSGTSTPFFNARFLFDWYEVIYPRQLVARADQLQLSTETGGAGPILARVRGFTSGADVLLIDVTDPANPVQVTLVPGQVVDMGGSFDLRFEHDNAAGTGRYLAAREAAARPIAAAEITSVGPPTLLAGGVGARWVGIAHDTLIGGTQALAAYRRTRQTAHAVRLSEVWDVFMNGRRDPAAIKSFAAYAFHRWSDPLVFLLLVGDASEDHRGVGANADPDLLPSHSLWTDYEGAPEETDQYYAEVTQDVTGRFDDLSDLYVGRLALNTPEELDWNVERIRIYETEGADELWRRRVFLLADDAFSGDLGGGVGTGYSWQGIFEKQFCIYSQAYAESLDAHPADDLVPEVLCLADYTSPCADSCYIADSSEQFYAYDCEDLYGIDCGMIYDCRITPQQWGAEYDCIRATVEPVLVPEIRNRLNDGALVWNYQGHANKYFLAHEIIWRDDVLDQSRRDVLSLRNVDRPFIFLGFACHLAEFDRADERANEDCLSEKMMNVRTPDQDRPAGAIAAFASSGFEFLFENLFFNQDVVDALFFPERSAPGAVLPDDGSPGYVWTLGESTTRARLNYQTRYPQDSQRRQAAQRFVLLGDPGLSPDIGSPALSVTVDGTTVENPADPFFASTDVYPDSVTVAVTASDGRGIVETRIVDTELGVISPDQYEVVEELETSDGVAQRVRMTRRFTLRSEESYDVRFEAVDAAGKTSAFVLRMDNTFTFLDHPVAFPNPFNQNTSIAFKTTGSPRSAALHVYTVAGRKIREVHQQGLAPNVEQVLEWDGRDDHGLAVANGTYLLRLSVTSNRGSVSEALPVVRIQ